MMHRMLLVALLLASPVAAQSSLPPEAAAQVAIDLHPAVAAASVRVQAARARAGMSRKGSNEFELATTWSRRDIDREGRFNEFDAVLSRPFRLPGKATLDRSAGALDLSAAENRRADARHETALLLAELWFDWLGSANHSRNEVAIVTELETAVKAVRRRLELRDASRLDLDLADAALADARARAAAATATEARARIRLAVAFSDLSLPPQAPELVAPELPAIPLSVLRNHVVEHSHEIVIARLEAERLATLAERARRDRVSDPTFGVRLFSERGGLEKGVGLVANLPLGGSYRRLKAEEAAAEASAAHADLRIVERDIRALAATDEANARLLMAVWEQSDSALRSALEALRKTERAYALAQIDQVDLLTGRRQAAEIRRAEIDARLNAWRALVRLQIDAHQLWAVDVD